MAKLVVLSEEMKDRTFELTDEKITIGRLPDNLIRLEDQSVSSHHAELTLKGEDYMIRDLNSTNGTRVNGQRVIETRLYHGDTVHFGHLEIQYLSAVKGVQQPMPAPRAKTVTLQSGQPGSITSRPSTFSRTSAFNKQGNPKSKKALQYALIFFGILAIGLLSFVFFKILGAS